MPNFTTARTSRKATLCGDIGSLVRALAALVIELVNHRSCPAKAWNEKLIEKQQVPLHLLGVKLGKGKPAGGFLERVKRFLDGGREWPSISRRVG